MTDVGNKKLVKRARKKAKSKEETKAESYRKVLRTAAGREVVWDILNDCGIFGSSFSPGNSDAMSFKEGARNVGLKLLERTLTNVPGSYNLMQDENRIRDHVIPTNPGEEDVD